MALLGVPASATWSGAERASVATGGAEGNASSDRASISFDGRYVAFQSDASNLVGSDSNGVSDVFVRDRTGATTSRASVASDGSQANRLSVLPSISGDGRYVAFQSDATNLVTDDANGTSDVFLRDLVNGTTERVSTSSAGDNASGPSGAPSVSYDGRFVAFFSLASNLVVGDSNSWWDVFVKDRANGVVERVSVATGGTEGDNMSFEPAISFDGRYVAFTSRATNLVAGDTNSADDIFVRDRLSSTTERASTAFGGGPSNGPSDKPSISYDGAVVGFETLATNLITDDTNGAWDVYVRDRNLAKSERVSIADGGAQALGSATPGSVSWDGGRIAFTSAGSTIVAGDTNLVADAFVRDRSANATYRTSVAGVTEINGATYNSALSGDGRLTAFATLGNFGLTLPDGNGASDVYLSGSGEPPLTTTPSPSPFPEITPGPPPASPSGLEATATSSSRIDISWLDNSGDETLFKVERRAGVGAWSQVATAAAGATAYADTSLPPSTSFTYRVRAANPDSNSGYTNEATATTLSATPPAPPSGLTATAIAGNSVSLLWSDNSIGESAFVIERRTPPDPFTEVATAAFNSTVFTDSSVAPVVTYVYRVHATGPGGDSPPSNELTLTTPTDSPPAAPSSLAILTTTADQAWLGWADNSGNETGFDIQRAEHGGAFATVASVGSDETAFTDSGLTPSITYDYRVLASNSGGSSPPSNVASATTRSAPVCRSDQVVFISARDGNYEIYAMNADGTRTRRVTNTPSDESHPVLAPSGEKIYFAANDSGTSQIYSINLDGSNRRRLTENSSSDTGPVVSPDGLSVAFTSDRSGAPQIWIMNADGSGQTRLTSSVGSDSAPAFAPAATGRVLAFTGDESGSSQLYTMTFTIGPFTAGSPLRLTPGDTANQVFPAWAPNGGELVFISDKDAPEGEIYRRSVSTGDVNRLTSDSAAETQPAWSPDGSKVYYMGNQDGDPEIYSMPVTGGPATRLTSSPGFEFEPNGGVAAPWAVAPSSNYLAEGASTGGFETWILISNPSASTSVTACVTYLTDAGPVAGPVVTIAPQSRVSRPVSATVKTFNVSTVVEGIDGQVVAERALYSSRSDIPGAHAGLAVNSPATQWHAAEGSTANGFETWVLVANPSRTTPARATLSFLTSSGSRAGPSGDLIPPGQRRSYRVASYVPNTADVSTEVTSTGAAVLVERASYVNTASLKGATDSPAVPNPMTSWFLAEGASAGPFTTWILVENPQATTSKVTLRFLTSAGEVTGTVNDPIPPRSRRSYAVKTFIPGGDYNVSTEVTSDNPVVAERAMYTNDPALGRGASTGEGVASPSTDWLAVEGAAAGGFNTWILVANPNDKPACVNITYLTGAGPVSHSRNPVCLFARSRISVRVNDFVSPTFDVSTRVTSTVVGLVPVRPVVVERSVYTPPGPSQDSHTGPAYPLV